jgi:hypothetical protein
VALQCGNNEAEGIVMEGGGACVGTLPHLLAATAGRKHTILKKPAGLSTR